MCKFFVLRGSCASVSCLFRHEASKTELKSWKEIRSKRRQQVSRSEGDPHANEDKARKAARAEIFSNWLIDTFGRETLNAGSGVIDMAGGRGEVSF